MPGRGEEGHREDMSRIQREARERGQRIRADGRGPKQTCLKRGQGRILSGFQSESLCFTL